MSVIRISLRKHWFDRNVLGYVCNVMMMMIYMDIVFHIGIYDIWYVNLPIETVCFSSDNSKYIWPLCYSINYCLTALALLTGHLTAFLNSSRTIKITPTMRSADDPEPLRFLLVLIFYEKSMQILCWLSNFSSFIQSCCPTLRLFLWGGFL